MTADRPPSTAWTGLWVWLLAVAVGWSYAPLVIDDRFLWEGATGAAVVVASGVLLRGIGAGRAIVVGVQCVAAACWLTWAYGAGTGFLTLLPTAATWAEAQRVGAETYVHAQRYAAPVPDVPELTATLAALVIVVALVIDVMATELRWTPALGLVLLAVIMIPATLLDGRTQYAAFVLGAVAFAGLLAVTRRDEARSWGPRVLAPQLGASRSGSSRTAVPATVVAVGAVVAALVLPAVVPHAPRDLFSGGSGAGPGSGVGLDNPMLDMRRNLEQQSPRVLAVVRPIDGAPRPRYLRMASLQAVGERGWSLGDRAGAAHGLDDGIPSPPGLTDAVSTRDVRYRVSVDDGFETRWLPHVYAPTAFDIDEPEDAEINRSMLDVSKRSNRGDFAGSTYSFDAALARPTAAQLRAAPASTLTMSTYVALPSSTPDVVHERAEEVTAGATNAFDRALALQRWFRSDGDFTYSVERRPGSGMETIERFLTDDRIGYCEQFATAMAMMARSLGIPARVSIGFLSGEETPDGDAWVFRGTSMHAWPELYFTGVGWVGFEPTPGGRGYSVPNFAEGDTSANPAPGSDELDSTSPSAAPTAVPGQDAGDGAVGEDGEATTTRWPLALVALALLLVLLLMPMGIRQVVRHRRRTASDPATAVENAWSELRDTAVDLRLGWTDGLSPRAAAAPLRARFADDPEALHDLDVLVDATERSRYAPTYAPEPVRSTIDHLTASMRDSVPARRRLLATVLPASLFLRTGAVGTDEESDEVLSLRE